MQYAEIILLALLTLAASGIYLNTRTKSSNRRRVEGWKLPETKE